MCFVETFVMFPMYKREKKIHHSQTHSPPFQLNFHFQFNLFRFVFCFIRLLGSFGFFWFVSFRIGLWLRNAFILSSYEIELAYKRCMSYVKQFQWMLTMKFPANQTQNNNPNFKICPLVTNFQLFVIEFGCQLFLFSVIDHMDWEKGRKKKNSTIIPLINWSWSKLNSKWNLDKRFIQWNR